MMVVDDLEFEGEFLNPWDIWDHEAVAWGPHPKQQEIATDTTRHRLWCAGRREGKSNFGGHAPLPFVFLAATRAKELAKQGKRMEIWIVGPEYSDGEKEFRVFYNKCKALELPFDRPGTYNSPLAGNMHVSLWDGAFQLHVKSAKYPETLVGEELTGVILAEAAKLKPVVWTKYIRPMLNDQKGWSIHTSTPEGKNWFYDNYIRGQKPGTNWKSWRTPAWLNPHVYTEPTVTADVYFLLDMVRKYPSESAQNLVKHFDLTIDSEIVENIEDNPVEVFKQEIAADFTEYVGKVFKDFDPDYHVGSLTFHPDWETFAAIDYGYRNPNVWLLGQIGPHGEINFLEEVYERGLTDPEFAKEIRRRQLNPSILKFIYPDPSSPESTAVLVDELRVTAKPHTGGELEVRLNMIRKALKKGIIDYDGVYDTRTKKDHRPGSSFRPQIMFDFKCPRTINDFEAYRYPKDKEDLDSPTSTNTYESPVKVDDHGPEAVGRFFAGRFGVALTTPQQTSRVSKARISGPGTSRYEKRESGLYAPQKPMNANYVGMHESDGYEYKTEIDGVPYYDEEVVNA
jgi:hypothetical protein